MSSASSFSVVSRPRSRPSTSSSVPDDLDDSGDEIVWSVDGSVSSSDAASDDFVVLSRPRSPPSTLVSDLARLSVNHIAPAATKRTPSSPKHDPNQRSSAKRHSNHSPPKHDPSQRPPSPKHDPNQRRPSPNRGYRHRAGRPQSPPFSPSPSPTPTPVANHPPTPKSGHRRRNGKQAGSPTPRGLGARPIVDDVSELPDTASERDDTESVVSMYEMAASCINAFLADKTSVGRLTLLQSLIIELGLASSSPPASLTAAKAILKSHAFLNVGEYLAARQHGPAAVQGVLHKSRASLIRDIRRKRNPTPLQWVKENGLQVLLVSCYH